MVKDFSAWREKWKTDKLFLELVGRMQRIDLLLHALVLTDIFPNVAIQRGVRKSQIFLVGPSTKAIRGRLL